MSTGAATAFPEAGTVAPVTQDIWENIAMRVSFSLVVSNGLLYVSAEEELIKELILNFLISWSKRVCRCKNMWKGKNLNNSSVIRVKALKNLNSFVSNLLLQSVWN